MATAEELLRTVNPETEPHIVIDNNRDVAVPIELRYIAVQYDHNIETVTFDCPRFWDEHDLSEMQVFINYMRADGKVGQYHCDDVTVDQGNDTIMHFTWTISGYVTEVSGNISFLVCVKATDADGELKNRWSSNLNQQMVIKDGMIASEVIYEMQPDVIAAMLLRLENVETVLDNVTTTLASARKAMLPAGILYGDVNGDGEINARDSRLITDYLAGTATEDKLKLEAADVNGDGVVDNTDAELILQYAASIITEFEAGICTNWHTDGEYYYYDLDAPGTTKNMSVIVTAHDVEIVKTECMQDAIRVYVAAPPAVDTPYSVHYIADWDNEQDTFGSVKNRPIYIDHHNVTWDGTGTPDDSEGYFISNLTPRGDDLVDSIVKFTHRGNNYEWPIIAHCITSDEVTALKNSQATDEYLYAFTGAGFTGVFLPDETLLFGMIYVDDTPGIYAKKSQDALCSYNNKRLPPLPEYDTSIYTHAFIVQHNLNGIYQLFLCPQPHIVNEQGYIVSNESHSGRVWRIKDNEWDFRGSSHSDSSMSLDDFTLIWSNYDIQRIAAETEVFLTGSDPVEIFADEVEDQTGITYTYLVEMDWSAPVVDKRYKSLFKNNIHVVSVESDDVSSVNFDAFVPGDIILVVTSK